MQSWTGSFLRENSRPACGAQATFLLLETLDLDMLLQLVGGNTALTAESHRFGSAADRERIDAELRTWWNSPSPTQTPVLLGWAAFSALAAIIAEGAPQDIIFLKA